MKFKEYNEPEFLVIMHGGTDVLTTSGGDDFNMRGDQPNSTYFANRNWTIEI